MSTRLSAGEIRNLRMTSTISHRATQEVEQDWKERYSISRAILTADLLARGQNASSLELDISREIERNLPPSVEKHGGVFVPTMLTRSGLAVKTSSAGAELAFTSAGPFIDALRNRALVLSLGATMLTRLRDTVGFSFETAPGAASWVAENPGSDVADADITLDLATVTPKRLTASTAFSKQLLAQSTPEVDGVVTNDLAQINAIALDRAAIHGAGTNEPVGIFGTLGVNAVAMAGALTFAKVVDLESQIAINNGETDQATMGYLTTPEIRARGKQIAELTNSLRIWLNGQMNDRRAEASNQISKTMNVLAPTGGTSHGIVFGVWSELYFLEWGAMELIIDPFRLKKQGMTEVTSFLLANLIVRHPKSFAVGTGLTTA